MELNDTDDVQRLIRLKRYESPGDEYFRSFAEGFKERQRSELLKQSARGLLLERVSLWFEESGGSRRLIPAGAFAVAAVGAGLYFAFPGEIPPSDNGDLARIPSVETFSPVQPEEAFSLQLPDRKVRVPGGLEGDSQGSPVLVPASVKGSLREL